MKKKIPLVTLSVLLVALYLSADAQQSPKMPRIGYLTGATPDGQTTRIEAFRQGLRDLGYIEGQNLGIEYRYAEGNAIGYLALRPI